MKSRGADIIIRILEKLGIRIISGIPGGSNLPLYDALYRSSIRHILARHEQAAGFIAHGMARSTGKTAVCFATSGPGVTNLLTAIADAKMDSVPLIAITGQVPLNLIGTDAFQEVDAYGLSTPITKHNFLVRSAKDLPEVIVEAFRIASSGRPGPVLIDVPKDIQTEEVEWDDKITETPQIPDLKFDKNSIEKAALMIRKSERPLFLIGGGVIHSGAGGLLKELAHKNSIPIVTTLMGLGAYPGGDELFIGMIGMHGSKTANNSTERADLIITCGTRFNDRATGKVSQFCRRAEIIHIDIDDSEIDKNKKADCTINGDIKSILSGILPLVPADDRTVWNEELIFLKQEYPDRGHHENDIFHPENIIRETGSLVPDTAIITTDVGQHQMWVAQWYPFKRPRTFLTSGGLGTMGFGLPAAIGAALSNPDKKVVCFTGDGSILMNIQELATLSECGLNITIILLNNGNLGLVRQQQDLFYEKHFIASKFVKNPDFIAIGEGFGIKSIDLYAAGNPMKILAAALESPFPIFINVPVSENTYALPMVSPGSSNLEMIDRPGKLILSRALN